MLVRSHSWRMSEITAAARLCKEAVIPPKVASATCGAPTPNLPWSSSENGHAYSRPGTVTDVLLQADRFIVFRGQFLTFLKQSLVTEQIDLQFGQRRLVAWRDLDVLAR